MSAQNKPYGIDLPAGTFQVFTPDGWQDVCKAKTWVGATRALSKVKSAGSGYGGIRRADGSGPNFGTPRFLTEAGEVWRVDYTLDCPVPPKFDY